MYLPATVLKKWRLPTRDAEDHVVVQEKCQGNFIVYVSGEKVMPSVGVHEMPFTQCMGNNTGITSL